MSVQGALDTVPTEPGNAGGERVLEVFLPALMAARKSLSLLTHLGEALQTGGGRTPEHIRQLAELQERLGGRGYVALLGGVLRQHAGNERQLTRVAQYLGLVARGTSRSSLRSWGRSATGRSGPGCARCWPRWAYPSCPPS